MASKYHYYVLVLTMAGPVFVTGEEGHNWARWEKTEPPMEFPRDYARDMVIGLNLNGHMAMVVSQPFEMETQPYRYELGQFKWQMKEELENEKAGV